MSHVDQGPLPAYNSLTDNNLSGYFASTRMRSHLRRAGLITRRGQIVSENTYRLNMSRKEHKKHVKDMLAQAIVHKTLDLERSRQAEIRKKLEEIAKIELVRRVRSERHKQTDENILPYLSPKTSKSRTKRTGKSPAPHSGDNSSTRGTQNNKGSREPKKSDSVVHERASRDRKRENYVLPLVSPRRESSCQSSITSASSSRPMTRRRVTRPSGGSPSRKGRRPISALSSNYDDENETVVYLDDEGRPISPAHIDRTETKYSSKDPIDTRHLYSLDTAALRKYAMLMAKMEQGRGGLASPYLIPQVPLPPKSPRSGRAPQSANRQRSDSDLKRFTSPKRPATASQAYLHPAGPPKQVRGQMETMCEVFMEYHGSSLSLVREQFDKRQDIIVEQQHCGGNTLTVFRDKMEAGTKFSFISYRHRGYPFSLSIYIDGKIDCRVSVCCEHRHSKGGRIGGKKGHFSISSITGAIPCYKCQVEKGIRVKSAAPRRKLKRPPQTMEEVTVVETQDKEEVEEQTEPVEDRSGGEEILVPVDDDDDDRNGGQSKSEAADYDEDFDSETEEEGYIYNEAYNNERGGSSENDYEDDFDNDDDDDSRKIAMRDAANVIRAANRLIKESAINAEKVKKDNIDNNADDKRGERTKRRESSDKRRGKRDDERDDDDYNDDSHQEEEEYEKHGSQRKQHYSSISSIGEDEDYYAYKERMMKKLEEQERKMNKKKRSGDGKTKKSPSKVDDKEDSPRKQQQVDKNGKKMSSTSSALGQAEPVEAGSGNREKRKGKGGKRATKGNNDGEEEGSGSDVRDTADEVSEIESEMAAASPRKADSVTNLAGPEMSGNSKTSSSGKGQDNSEGEGKTNDKMEGGCKDGDIAFVKNDKGTRSGIKDSAKNKNNNVKASPILTKVVNENKAESKIDMSSGMIGSESKGEDVKEIGEGNVDGHDKAGQEFHVDLYPKESIDRAEDDFNENIKRDEDNDRGVAKEEGKIRHSKRYGEGSEGEDVMDLRRGDKWAINSDKGKGSPKNNNRQSSKHVVKRPKEGLKQKHISKVEAERDEYVDAGAGFVGVQGGQKSAKRSPRSKGSHFESETVAFPMMKTGQNPYLREQEKENAVQHRMKSDSFSKRAEDKEKRQGRFIRDLSPETKVIRGFVGDDGSEGEDEDETYSKINLLDGRANTSDSEMETVGNKDYILSNGKQSRPLKKQCTFDLSNQYCPWDDDEAEDRPNYRVLINVGRERDREKSKIKAIIRQKRVEEKKEKKIRIVEDTRGDGDTEDGLGNSSQHRSVIMEEDEGHDIEVKVHNPHHISMSKDYNNCHNTNGERYQREHRQNNLQNHHHTFSEEPPLSTNKTGSRNTPMQAVASSDSPGGNGDDYDDDFMYSSDEDHSNADDDGIEANRSGNNQVEGSNNPETWYRVPEAANMVQSEEFLGATEEIHRTKYVNDEEQRYTKNQRAFKESPDVDNEFVKKTGGVVSVLTAKPLNDEDASNNNPGILSFSVNKQGEKYTSSNDILPTLDEKETHSDSQKSMQVKDIENCDNVLNGHMVVGENDQKEMVKSNNISSNLEMSKGATNDCQHSHRTEADSKTVYNEYNEGSGDARSAIQDGLSEKQVGEKSSNQENVGDISDVDENQPENGRRDSNYMADLSSGSLSESGGTQSSSRKVEGRNVRKKKRKDRKKAENNTVSVVGGVDVVDGDKDIDYKEQGEEDYDLKGISKGRVAELQREDRKFSSGSIPDVIITSADESCEMKFGLDDIMCDDVVDGDTDKTKTEHVGEKSKTETLDDENVSDGGVKGKSTVVDTTENDDNNTALDGLDGSASPTGGTNGKKVVLELQSALCDDESSADDVSGIDALIEVLEDQLADSESQKSMNGKNQENQKISGASSPHIKQSGSGVNMETTDNSNDKNPDSISADSETTTNKDEKYSDINELKSSGIGAGSSTVIYGGGADEVETLVSMNNATVSDEDAEEIEKESSKNKPGSRIQRQGSVDLESNSSPSQSENMEDLDHQAELIVSKMLSSINQMAGLDPDILKESSSHKQSDKGIIYGNESSDIKPKEELSEDAKLESEVSDLLLKAFPIAENEVEKEIIGENIGENKELPASPTSTPSTPSGRKSSLTTNQDSAHIERRRQRKLTVSFAVDESQENGHAKKTSEENAEEDEFYSWEEAADSEKEEEYEQLERELERALCGSKR